VNERFANKFINQPPQVTSKKRASSHCAFVLTGFGPKEEKLDTNSNVFYVCAAEDKVQNSAFGNYVDVV
jgi:hypothetical protein